MFSNISRRVVVVILSMLEQRNAKRLFRRWLTRMISPDSDLWRRDTHSLLFLFRPTTDWRSQSWNVSNGFECHPRNEKSLSALQRRYGAVSSPCENHRSSWVRSSYAIVPLHLFSWRPGTYECDVQQNRQVHMLHSFGGRTKMIPAVKTKCMITNNDKVRQRKPPEQQQFRFVNSISVCHLSDNTVRRLLPISRWNPLC